MTLIDTAEMYGAGASERLVGRAIAGRRDDVFLVSKVLPQHATFDGTLAACVASLKRPGHGPPRPLPPALARPVPLARRSGRSASCKRTGLIRHWGVSNFDTAT